MPGRPPAVSHVPCLGFYARGVPPCPSLPSVSYTASVLASFPLARVRKRLAQRRLLTSDRDGLLPARAAYAAEVKRWAAPSNR